MHVSCGETVPSHAHAEPTENAFTTPPAVVKRVPRVPPR
jgi:hypothetical protein